MKLLLLTNMASYHQIELAEAFNNCLGDGNFCMGILAPLSQDRLNMNWQDAYQASYLVRFSESGQARDTVHQWIQSADVVIQGRFPIQHLRKRIAAGGLTFAYQERIWKKGFSLPRLISRIPHLYKNYWSVNRGNYHLLAAGAYASDDLLNLGVFKNRCWKFGYFISAKPPVRKPSTRSRLELVWCGQLIALKQPFKALQIAAALRDQGVDFRFTMIGGGELSADVEAAISSMQLDDQVVMVGWKTVAEVNDYMAAADIMLMTSNHREGWGMVINEAINNQCLVVANAAAGAAKWLIQDGETGLVYEDQELPATIDKLVTLCNNRDQLRQMAEQAYHNLSTTWSTEVVAGRFLKLSVALLSESSGCREDGARAARDLFNDGPCSAV